MLEQQCNKCGKVLKGRTERQLEHSFRVHNLASIKCKERMLSTGHSNSSLF